VKKDHIIKSGIFINIPSKFYTWLTIEVDKVMIWPAQ